MTLGDDAAQARGNLGALVVRGVVGMDLDGAYRELDEGIGVAVPSIE